MALNEKLTKVDVWMYIFYVAGISFVLSRYILMLNSAAKVNGANVIYTLK